MDSKGNEEDDVFQKAIKEKIKLHKRKERKVCLLGVNRLYMKIQKYKNEYNVEYVNTIRNKRDKSYFEMYKEIANIINEDNSENELNKNTKKDNFYLTSLINTKYFNIDKTENNFFLNHLRSITLSNRKDNPNIYELTFAFNPNDSFTNTSIIKTYTINPQTDKVIHIKVTPIKWKVKETDLHRSLKQNTNNSNKQSLIHYLTSPQDNPKNDNKIAKQNELNLALETNNFNFFKKEYLPQLLEYYLNFIHVNEDIETEIKHIELKHKLYK